MNQTRAGGGQHGAVVPGGPGRVAGSTRCIPALTGSAAVLLIGAGMASLIRGRHAGRGRILATREG